MDNSSNNSRNSKDGFSIGRRKFLATSTALTTGLVLGFPGILTSKNKTRNESEADYFVLIADTHIDKNPHTLRAGSNMFDNLETAVNRILNNGKYGKPDGVIILGDLANTHGLVGEFALSWTLLRHLSNAGIPVHIAMGNHENRENFYTVFPDHKPEDPMVQGRHVEIIESRHTYHIILDTLARVDEYITWGELGEAQRNWLDETLKTYNDKPVMLHGHHYPWPNTQDDGSIRGLKDYEELIELTHDHKHVKGYYFGHSHRLDTDPYGRVDVDTKGLNLLNVPTNAGHAGNQPVGYIHALYYSDKADFEIECIDTSEQWHGNTFSKTYRS
ncbi:metallophosphoesterase family protein [Natronogracilivirga saccharolytica]|uniref:Metallophosphoesterase n=1 Tax=Natronogracilivirga saccharolytica TaxID=2812953 RepID=A0A8J7UWT1_9BACT|nr:metallophosphoesterase [Natronogracilivirga saccharolytica]MBP3193967.1 metallophosphoesterase [Natronogracilivirga saccharolytica]